jgi:hypothetical protein
MPVPAPIVATAVLPLLHIPPAVVSINVVVKPAHILAVPVIAAGNESTVSVIPAAHPVADKVYIIVDVPGESPTATPEAVPIVAIPILLLLHFPPPVISLKEVALPAHTAVMPVIAAGAGLTVIVLVTLQPVESE